MKGGGDAGKYARRYRRAGTDAQMTRNTLFEKCDFAIQVFGLGQNAPPAFDDAYAHGRRLYRALGAVEELYPGQGFRRLNAARKRRLRKVGALGGAAEAELIGEQQEVMEVAQVHVLIMR